MKCSYICYHGTNHANVPDIKSQGFRPSQGDDEWAGDGIYTFIDKGLRDPKQCAEDWSRYKAWKDHYQFCSVIEMNSSADSEDIIDLTTADGVRYLEYLEVKCLRKLKEAGKTAKFVEGTLINLGRDQLGYPSKIVIGDFYIRLTKNQLVNRISQRTPNCTICCLNDPNCIDKNTVREIKTWRIEK